MVAAFVGGVVLGVLVAVVGLIYLLASGDAP